MVVPCHVRDKSKQRHAPIHSIAQSHVQERRLVALFAKMCPDSPEKCRDGGHDIRKKTCCQHDRAVFVYTPTVNRGFDQPPLFKYIWRRVLLLIL